MVVRRLVSEIEAAEGEVQASVGEVLHVGRDEAENPQVPVGHAREIDGLQDEMPELRPAPARSARTVRLTRGV